MVYNFSFIGLFFIKYINIAKLREMFAKNRNEWSFEIGIGRLSKCSPLFCSLHAAKGSSAEVPVEMEIGQLS